MRCFSMFAITCVVLLAGCKPKTTHTLQQPENFAHVYAKILLAIEVEGDSLRSNSEPIAARATVADSVLYALGFTRQEFEAATAYFSQNPQKWREVYTNVVKILEENLKQESQVETKKDTLPDTKDG